MVFVVIVCLMQNISSATIKDRTKRCAGPPPEDKDGASNNQSNGISKLTQGLDVNSLIKQLGMNAEITKLIMQSVPGASGITKAQK